MAGRPKIEPEERRKHEVRIRLTAIEHKRLLAAAKADRAFVLAHWMTSLALRRADELDIPEEAEAPKAKRAPKK